MLRHPGGRRTGWTKAANSPQHRVHTRNCDWHCNGPSVGNDMGHVTRISLVRRPLLSALASVQKFQRAHYSKAAFLWASCQSELKNFLYAMPLLESDWSLPSSGMVIATDACEDGKGVATADFASCQVSSEDACQSATASVSSQLHKGANTRSRIWTLTAIETMEDLSGKCEGRYVATLLRKSHCRPCMAPCGESEHRAGFPALKRYIFWRPVHKSGVPFVVKGGTAIDEVTLLDNVARALALSRDRARSFRLLRIVRRSCAIGQASLDHN